MSARGRRTHHEPPSRFPARIGRTLTGRQVEVVFAYIQTGSEKAAAHALGIAPGTVKNHLANGRSRVGALTTAQLVYVVARDYAVSGP